MSIFVFLFKARFKLLKSWGQGGSLVRWVHLFGALFFELLFVSSQPELLETRYPP